MASMNRLISMAFCLFCCQFMFGCGNNFKRFYTPNQSVLKSQPPVMSARSGETDMEVVYVDSIQTAAREWARNRYVPLGSSTFEASLQPESSLIRFGTSLGATHATYDRTYLRTNRGVVPLTMTNPTTSYTTGTIQTSSGTATYSETTYGTETTTRMMPYAIDRYRHEVIYWVPLTVMPATGVWPRDLTSEEATRFNRNTGAFVDVVVRGTPAFEANILSGDVIIRIDETPITSAQDYIDHVLACRGREVSLVFIRDGSEETVLIQISEETTVE